MDVPENLTQTLKDTAYVAVGLGVLGFQRAQVARRELTTTLAEDSDRIQAVLRAQVDDVSEVVGAQLDDVRNQVGKAVSSLEEMAESAAAQVRSLLAA